MSPRKTTRIYSLTSEEKSRIRHLYLDELLSYRSVATKLNLHGNAVSDFLYENNLMRSHKEAMKITKIMKRYPTHNSRFRGNLIHDGRGYMQRYLEKSDPYFALATKRNYVQEHRYVMAKHLGRLLLKSEIVHHINGIRDDNRIENLELVSQANHNMVTKYCTQCGLRKEIRLLRFQNSELLNQVRNLTSVVMGINSHDEGKPCVPIETVKVAIAALEK